MKKFLCVLALVAVIATGAAFADGFAIGVHGGYGGLGAGGGVNFVVSGLYFYIDALGLNSSSMHISGACDFASLFDTELVSTLGFYIRGGIGAGIWGWDNNMGLAISGRLPIGLSWKPIDLLEIFLQIVPQIGLQVLPEVGLSSNFWGGNLGIRLWF